jgi:asparaginyl-tRNA synthetase
MTSIDYTEDFFKTPVYLTTSGQLELEAYSSALSDVYSFGPTFRAELEESERHLAEFWMVECEFSFSDLDDVISLSEKYIKFCLKYILSKNKEDLLYIENHYSKSKNLINTIQEIIDKEFYKISYSKAIDILIEATNKRKNLFRDSVTWGISLSPEHEKYLTDEVFKFPVFVYNYPQRIKTFYMRENPDNETVASVDLLVPKIGEIIGGSVQEERFNILRENIKKFFVEKEEKGNLKLYDSYLDLRKFGTCPRSGFGVGFDRLVMLATGIEDIKDCIPYPRYPDYNEC